MVSARFVKFLVVVFGCVVIARAMDLDTGEPGCKTPAEVDKAFRNFLDPTRYWYCPALGAKAAVRKCGFQMAFEQNEKRCVPWMSWVWKKPVEPPSRPDGWEPRTKP